MGNLADYLRDLQKQRGISLRRMARESGVSASTLSRWLDGKQTPSPKSCKMIAEYLSLPIEHVLALAGHLRPLHKENPVVLAEPGEYFRRKYLEELDADIAAMIDDLIKPQSGERNASFCFPLKL